MNKIKTVLVTGAGGYIGSVTCDLLLRAGYDLVAVDNLSRGYHEPIMYLQKKYHPERVKFYKIDLAQDSLDKLFYENKIDAVMHFAALLNVGESWDIPEQYFRNNIGGMTNLLAAMVQAQVNKLVFSSSCTVYGNAQYTPIDERHPVAEPVTPYGASKQICEKLLSWQEQVKKLNYVSFRYFNVCGASDDAELGDSKRPSFHLVQNAVRGALCIAPFELNYAQVNTADGSPIRDYVNVVDLARAHVLGIKHLSDNPNTSEIFNLGTGQGNSVLEIIVAVKKITGVDFKVGTASQRRAGEADKMIADIAKVRKILGWQPERSLEDSVRTLTDWYKKHPRGWIK